MSPWRGRNPNLFLESDRDRRRAVAVVADGCGCNKGYCDRCCKGCSGCEGNAKKRRLHFHRNDLSRLKQIEKLQYSKNKIFNLKGLFPKRWILFLWNSGFVVQNDKSYLPRKMRKTRNRSMGNLLSFYCQFFGYIKCKWR